MVCLVTLVSSKSTEMESGQCDAIIFDLALALEADVHRMSEKLVKVEQKQQHLSTVIDDIKQMVMKIQSTLVNVSSQMLKEDHSTTDNLPCLQCPAEFLHRNSKIGSCYFISKTQLRWNDAAEDCKRRGSHLADIQSQEENDFLVPLLVHAIYHWIGGNDNAIENVWVWGEQWQVCQVH